MGYPRIDADNCLIESLALMFHLKIEDMSLVKADTYTSREEVTSNHVTPLWDNSAQGQAGWWM